MSGRVADDKYNKLPTADWYSNYWLCNSLSSAEFKINSIFKVDNQEIMDPVDIANNSVVIFLVSDLI